MAIEHPGLAWFAVIWIGVLLVLHSLVVMVIFLKTGKYLNSSQTRLVTLSAKVSNAAIALRHMLSHLEGLPGLLSRAEGRAPALLEPINQAVRLLDNSAASGIARLKTRLSRFDEAADTVLSNMSTETFRVHRAIVHPAMRLSELLQSVTGLFDRFAQGREKPPAAYSSDEEIFI